ncbi:MAG: hypothetical protein IPL06_02790 [Betaproteobacteria bacterium]|nr:hypothetical protein [Betaproteobacteria bacterium]
MKPVLPAPPLAARAFPEPASRPHITLAAAGLALAVLVAATAAAVNSDSLHDTVPKLPVASMSIAGLSPEAVPRGAGSFLLTVTGEGFGAASVVYWNGERRVTQVLSPTRLAAWVAASDVENEGPHAVTVVTPGAGRTSARYVATYPRAGRDAHADRVLGQPNFATRMAYHPHVGGEREGVLNAAVFDRLGPQGTAIDPASGRLFVVDSRAARVLSWPSARAFQNAEAADLVIGQADEFASGAKPAGDASFCSPQAVASDPAGSLYVSDECFNRVLRFDPPFATGMAAAAVYGQHGSFETTVSNRYGRSASSLSAPLGIAVSADALFVCDGGNRRVLVYRNPRASDKADAVIGQAGMASLAQSTPDARNLAGEGGALALDAAGRLFVADAAGNRVLRFSPPFADGMAADLVIGQKDFAGTGRSNFADGLWRPAALAFDPKGHLLVADSGNHRVLRFAAPFANGMTASGLIGQTSYGAALPGAGSSRLSTPSGLAVDAGGDVIVADAGNARVLAFDRPFDGEAPASLARGGQAPAALKGR